MGTVTDWLAFDISMLLVLVPFGLWFFMTYRRFHVVGKSFLPFSAMWPVILFATIAHGILLGAVYLWYRDESNESAYDWVLLLVHIEAFLRGILPFILEWDGENAESEAPSVTRNYVIATTVAICIILVFAWINVGLVVAASTPTATWVLWLIYAILITAAVGMSVWACFAVKPNKNNATESIPVTGNGNGMQIQALMARRNAKV